MKGKKVLVTGACGFIGSHLVDKLVDLGCEVVATDLPEPHDYFLNKRSFKKFLNKKAKFISANLTNEDEVTALFTSPDMSGVEVVFHLAAAFNFFKPYKFMYLNNVLATENICKAFAKFGFNPKRRIIVFSSGVVNSKILRSSKYGRSKWAEEEFLRNFLWSHDYIFEGVVVRPTAVFGPRSRYGLGKVIKMIAGGQLQFFIGKKELPASVVHVDDVVDAVVHLAKTPMEKLKEVTGGMHVPEFDIESSDRMYSYEELMRYAVYYLKGSHGTRLIPVHLPVWLMKIVTKWQEFLAKLFKRQPKATTDALDFFKERLIMNPFPLKNTGFVPKVKTLPALEEVIDWYREEGWI